MFHMLLIGQKQACFLILSGSSVFIALYFASARLQHIQDMMNLSNSWYGHTRDWGMFSCTPLRCVGEAIPEGTDLTLCETYNTDSLLVSTHSLLPPSF